MSIGIANLTTGAYKTGCSVTAYASDYRRAAVQVQFTAVVSDESGADQVAASAGVTDSAQLASNINSVITSDAAAYSSVATVGSGESLILSVGQATSALVSGGTTAPTSGAASDDSWLVIVAVAVTCGVLILIVLGLALWQLHAETDTNGSLCLLFFCQGICIGSLTKEQTEDDDGDNDERDDKKLFNQDPDPACCLGSGNDDEDLASPRSIGITTVNIDSTRSEQNDDHVFHKAHSGLS